MGVLKPKSIWHFVRKDLVSPFRHTFGGDTYMQLYGLFTADFVPGQTFSTASVGFHLPNERWMTTVRLIWDQEKGLVLQ